MSSETRTLTLGEIDGRAAWLDADGRQWRPISTHCGACGGRYTTAAERKAHDATCTANRPPAART